MEHPKFSTQSLTHLGLLAGVVKKTNLVNRIDKMLPVSKEKGAKTTMGERGVAMIYNALGFMDNRLYMFSEFLSSKPVARILGSHLKAEDFTDDALGRCLDAIHDYGTTKFVSDITFAAASQLNLLGKTVHIDSTSLTVYGDYNHAENKKETIPKVTHGHSKQHRPDLKQLILNLALTNKADLPIFMASHSGNASDQKLLIQAAKNIEKCCKELGKASSFIYVGDSAMYESCLKEADNILWISRVPMQRKVATKFILDNNSNPLLETIENDYKIYEEEKTIAGKKQRWLLVYSLQASNRAQKTLDRNKAKEEALITKALWHLGNQKYSCKEDAQKVLDKLTKGWKYHKILDSVISSIEKHEKRGVPKKGAEKQTVGYQIKATITENKNKIKELLIKKSHFILATNQFDKKELSNKEILSEYKGQQKVERGFSFIKDNAFEVSSVFLKKPSRIDALMAIMVLSLFIYSLTQYLLRE